MTAARLRLAAAGAFGSAVVLAAFLAAPAQAGTFRASQCNAVDRGVLSPREHQASLWSVDHGWLAADCGAVGGSIRIGWDSWRSGSKRTTTRFGLPASMPGTSMRTAWLDWRVPAHAPAGTIPAYVLATADGVPLFATSTGDGTPSGGARRYQLPAGARRLELEAWCTMVYGSGWCGWPGHLLELRGLTVELEEHGAPSAVASGALVESGTHSGVEPLEVSAFDADSGVSRVIVTLGGAPAGSIEPAEACRDDRLPPCPQSLRSTIHVDTRAMPDGPHRLRLTVTDAAGNGRAVDAATVHVDNGSSRTDSPPPPPADGGSAPGAPAAPFPRNPLSGRGHLPNGTHASERAWLDVWLERPGVRRGLPRRGTLTVPPGVRVRVRGRLTNEDGRPIGGAALAAVRREPGGPWTAVTGVRTRPNGRFTAFTRIGPSHQLRFVYYAYGDSRRGRRSRTLQVRVRAP